MPPRIPDDRRAAILADIQAGGSSKTAIAKKHGVSAHLVDTIAKEAGIVAAWDREQTKKATEARMVDHAARLVKIAGRMAGLTENILASFESMTLEEWSRVSPHSRGIVLGIATDKARDLGPQDDHGDEAAKSMMGAIFAGLSLASEQLLAGERDGGD
jgi:transposase-like protein